MDRFHLGLNRLYLRLLAETALIFGMKRRALELWLQRAEIDPSNERLQAAIGHLFAELGQVPVAIDYFVRLTRSDPDNATTWFNLGFLYDKNDRLAEAEKCFRRAVELKPKLDQAWYGLGIVLIRQHRLTEAVAALKQNTALQPHSPFGWYQLGMTLGYLGQEEQAQAIQQHLMTFEPRYAAQLARDLIHAKPGAMETIEPPVVSNDAMPICAATTS